MYSCIESTNARSDSPLIPPRTDAIASPNNRPAELISSPHRPYAPARPHRESSSLPRQRSHHSNHGHLTPPHLTRAARRHAAPRRPPQPTPLPERPTSPSTSRGSPSAPTPAPHPPRANHRQPSKPPPTTSASHRGGDLRGSRPRIPS